MSEILHTREMYFKLKWTSNRYLPTFWIIRNRVSVISSFGFFFTVTGLPDFTASLTDFVPVRYFSYLLAD